MRATNHEEPSNSEIPTWVFDGHSVYKHLSDKAKHRTSSENVSDTLDAIAAMLRSQQAQEEEGEELPRQVVAKRTRAQ